MFLVKCNRVLQLKLSMIVTRKWNQHMIKKIIHIIIMVLIGLPSLSLAKSVSQFEGKIFKADITYNC